MIYLQHVVFLNVHLVLHIKSLAVKIRTVKLTMNVENYGTNT